MLGSRIVIIRGTYDTYTRRELNEKSSKIRGGIYTRVSTIAFRRNADGISSFRSRRVAWRERKQLREDARRRKLAVLLASRRGADRWREGRKKFSACSSLGEEVDRGDGWKKRRGFREDSSGRGTLVEDVLLFRMVEIYVEILSLKELLVVKCFEIVVYLFIWSVRDWLGGIISRWWMRWEEKENYS